MPSGPFMLGYDVNYVLRGESFKFKNPGSTACTVTCGALPGWSVVVPAHGLSPTTSVNLSPGEYVYADTCHPIEDNPKIIVGG